MYVINLMIYLLRKSVGRPVVVLFMLFFSMAGKAQEWCESHSLAFRWGISVPARGQFVSESAYMNCELEWDWHWSARFSAGMEAGYRYSSEKGMTDDRYNGDAVSGYSERSYAAMPVTLHLRYLPLGAESFKFQPYLNLGGGAQYALFRITGEQINTSRSKNWGATLIPGIGCCYTPGKHLGFDLRCSWRYASNRWSVMNVTADKGMEITAGLVLLLGK